MGFINSEGKFNDNSYLIDGQLFKMSGLMAVYIIENKGIRMMIDTSSEIAVRKIVKKLKEFGLFPIHKLLLTHSHFDHIQGVDKLKKLMGDFEVLASENAIDDLKNPERISEPFKVTVKPIENVTPLKEGAIIDLNGLELEIINVFGHTMDSIAIFDKKNKNIFLGEPFHHKADYETIIPNFYPPDFNEVELLKTFQKLRNMKDDFNSISLAHFGVWKDEDVDKILDEMEEIHFKTKDAIIKWYNENPTPEYITAKYHETFIPNSKIHTKEKIFALQKMIEWQIIGLKTSGFIK